MSKPCQFFAFYAVKFRSLSLAHSDGRGWSQDRVRVSFYGDTNRKYVWEFVAGFVYVNVPLPRNVFVTTGAQVANVCVRLEVARIRY